MNGVTSLATISYLDRWSWRTWTLVQSLNTRIAALEREVENLQEDLNIRIVELERQVESMQQDVDVVRAEASQRCAPGTGSNELGGGRDRSRDRRR